MSKKPLKRNLLSIDTDNLDGEIKELPDLIFEYGNQLSDLRLARDEAAQNVKVLYSELEASIRENPDDYNLPKVTENSLKSCIARQKSYIKAQQAERAIHHDAEMMQNFVTALNMKRAALKYLVELHGQQYFASSRLDPKGVKELKKKIDANVRKVDIDDDEDDIDA